MEKKECQYCLSEIPIKAQKCKFCLEWQEDKNLQDLSNEKFSTGYNLTLNLKEPFQYSIVKWTKFHYLISVFVFSLFIFAFVQLLWYLLDEDKIYLLSFLAYTFQMMIVWGALIWMYKVIDKNFLEFLKISSLDEKTMTSKLLIYQDLIFSRKFSIWIGILIGLIASVGDFLVGTPFHSLEAKLVYATFQFITMFFAGAAIFSMVIFSFFIYTISKESDLQTLDLDKKNTINYIGSIHLKSAMITIVPFFLGVVAKFIGDWSWEFLIILWYSSFAILIIFYIYWPMLNIHNLMQTDVDNQVLKVKLKIQKKLKELDSYPSSRNFMKLNELRDLENKLSSQNTWPFDLKSISAAFVAIIFPILLIIIDKIWSI
ncbi:MAG: hypothetical protein HKP59_01275 [Lutibacter sp.]|uniref:hypothetical protein n=1 Tax=Lutibacter sp. TaxID=1925666 RepID=UPI0017E81B4B|nr:hypothetical protein [Lutibacter sp.]MBT8316236.1 hypothetical protein [Lutibacter sp.]NNJ57096.1 hypothetical protein [Lutibacter sp.]